MDLDRYFERIGYRGGTEPTLAALAALHEAHVFSIPFENLDVCAGLPISLELEDLFEKIVLRGRGGYCYEMNTLFAGVLRELGFRVAEMLARTSNGGPYTAKLHHTMTVEIDGSLHLADVGYGTDGISSPLRLEFDAEQRQFGNVYRFTRDERLGHVLERRAGDGFIAMYAFTLEEAMPVDFEAANYYNATHPDSFFRAAPFCTMPTPSGRVTLSASSLKIVEGGRVSEREVRGEDEFAALLMRHFGLEYRRGQGPR
ncbi:MAG: arylamine N-acetyltransferase [Clostridiales Family XIII bacterium]|nr:arylamine N-acetyltransferase [Clostridiales Family XIII bacterium]